MRRCYGKFDRKSLLRFTRESFPERIFPDFRKKSSPWSLWGKAPRSLQGRSSGTVPWKVSGKVSEKLLYIYSFIKKVKLKSLKLLIRLSRIKPGVVILVKDT